MAKRPYPFESNTFRQAKVHLNNIENDSKALKIVEEKTLKKLQEGSKKVHSIVLNNEDNSRSEIAVYNIDKFKQTFITKYVTINGKTVEEKDGILKSISDICGKCFFCELTSNPIYQCETCLEYYCGSCSFVVYDTPEEKRLCLSCS